ncbi:MAG TPA: nuclear transport factor 2 family protein [Nitrososphaeraceae archaeon]|nr:nuclear transport factor 2 family protein [Nitrososphaeraceae archaeon]
MPNHTPEEVLSSVVDGINTGNMDSVLTSYESAACFTPKPGQIVKGQQSIRQNLQVFIDMKGKLESNVKRVLQASDLALIISEWSFNGTGPDGNPVNLASTATDVLRRQSDGTWLITIDNPWGTE